MTINKRQTTKQKQLKKNVIYPERNLAAEVTIQLGVIGILGFVPLIIFFSLIALFFNDTGSEMVAPATFLILLFCINISVQCVRTLRELSRVDRYWQRIASICMILLAPITWILLQPLIADHFPSAMNLLHVITVILATLGSSWLWVLLLLKKNKLVWVRK